ncbi:MAG: AmmeMemoRadiSam system protein B [bacterium]
MIREPRFAHDWYPGTPDRLRSALQTYVGSALSDQPVFGVIAPHAGYIYSGAVAGATYARIRVPDLAAVCCVNHRGIGPRVALMSSGQWQTPLGLVPIRSDFCRDLLKNTPLVQEDITAHLKEHSLELQLPFLQYRNDRVCLVPICLQHLDYAECEILGEGIARTIRSSGEDVLLVASTDMTHFEPEHVARERDDFAIRKILDLDPRGLYEIVQEKDITMCGTVPTTVVLCACKELGAKHATLVRYSTSADVTGDRSNVVGYAGILLF